MEEWLQNPVLTIHTVIKPLTLLCLHVYCTTIITHDLLCRLNKPVPAFQAIYLMECVPKAWKCLSGVDSTSKTPGMTWVGSCLHWLGISLPLFHLISIFPLCSLPVSDFLIITMSLIDFLLPLIESTGNFSGGQASTIFRILKLFKGVRAIRAFRVLHTIR